MEKIFSRGSMLCILPVFIAILAMDLYFVVIYSQATADAINIKNNSVEGICVAQNVSLNTTTYCLSAMLVWSSEPVFGCEPFILPFPMTSCCSFPTSIQCYVYKPDCEMIRGTPRDPVTGGIMVGLLIVIGIIGISAIIWFCKKTIWTPPKYTEQI
jgi:hypothetical protein